MTEDILTPFVERSGITVYKGDCIETMRRMPEASVDAIVTDPPYGLEFMGKEWDSFAEGRGKKYKSGGKLNATKSVTPKGGTNLPIGPSYTSRPAKRCAKCGKQAWSGSPCQCDAPEWVIDNSPLRAFQSFSEAWAREAYRVLKPGGHLLAFGGTRTYHRLAAGIEDAGFEIRDCLAWLYGSGFPKSLDVSKAIDKQRYDRAEVYKVTAWIREARDAAGVSNSDIDAAFGFHGMAGHWTSSKSQPAVPTLDQVPQLLDVLGVSPDDVPERIRRLLLDLNGRKGQPGEAWFQREVVGQRKTGIGTGSGSTPIVGDGNRDITAPATPDAEKWQGWGTALKPAFEPIVLARKPLIGTVAANVLEHGTGALNIDECRIEHDGTGQWGTINRSNTRGVYGSFGDEDGETPGSTRNPIGRWPANVTLDETAAAMLDEQSGTSSSKSASMPLPKGHAFAGEQYGGDGSSNGESVRGFDDAGGASRFFYCAKASKKDRNTNGAANTHPTVKPTELMRWLIRLVTPPGGIVLDPFGGSGSTGVAAQAESVRCILIERENEYLDIIRQRLDDGSLFSQLP